MSSDRKSLRRVSLPPVSVPHDPTEQMLQAGLIQAPRGLGMKGSLGDYELLRWIGQGGMGVVYEGKHRRSERSVAIKLLRPELFDRPSLQDRFTREALLLRSLEHRHIVPLLGVAEGELAAGIVMPYYEDGCLAKQIADRRVLSRERILVTLEQVCLALDYAHSRGLIHYDLKPGNILFESSRQVRLADFGLARSLGASVSELFGLVGEGTIHYFSPGQAAGKVEDTRADIYALGAILYEILTGFPPFQGQTIEQVRQAILAGPPVPIAHCNRQVDADLLWIAERAMARSVKDRYENAEAMLDDVSAAQEKRPLPSKAKLISVFFSEAVNRRLGIAGCLVACLMLCFILSWLLLPQFRLEHEISSPHVGRWRSFRSIEWDGLPGDELVAIEGDSVLVFSSRGELLTRLALGDSIYPWSRLVRGLDTNGDGRDELTILRGRADETKLVVYDQNPREIASFSIIPSPPDDRNRNFSSILLPEFFLPETTTRSGRAELLAVMGTYYSKLSASPWKRGIAVFDFESGHRKWEVLTGGSPRIPHLIDLDGDGYVDYVFSTGSVRNGNIGPDEHDDFSAFLYGVNHIGEVLFTTRLGGEYDTPKIVGVLGSHEGERLFAVVVMRAEFGNEADTGFPSRLVLVSEHGEIVNEISFPHPIQDGFSVDLEGDGDSEVMALDRSGRLYCFDDGSMGQPIELASVTGSWRNPLDRVLSTFLGHGRFRPGDHQEYLAISVCESYHYGGLNPGDHSKPPTIKEFRNQKILFLDHNLDVVGECRLNSSQSANSSSHCITADCDGDGVLEIVWFTDRAQIYSWRSGAEVLHQKVFSKL